MLFIFFLRFDVDVLTMRKEFLYTIDPFDAQPLPLDME